MKRYWKYIKPYLPAFICGPLLMIVEVIGEVLLPKFMANIINIGAANQDVPYIITMGIVMVVTALLMMAGGSAVLTLRPRRRSALQQISGRIPLRRYRNFPSPIWISTIPVHW